MREYIQKQKFTLAFTQLRRQKMLDFLQKLQKNKPLYYGLLGGLILLVVVLSLVMTLSTTESCKKKDPPIVGEWLFPAEHGTYEFTVDGAVTKGFLEDDGYSDVSGSYTFEEGVLSMTLADGTRQHGCVINGDVMTWTIEGLETPYILYRIANTGSIIGTWESLDNAGDDSRTFIFEEGQLLLDYDSYAYTVMDGKIYIYDYYDETISFSYDLLGEDSEMGMDTDESGEGVIIGEEPSTDLVMNCTISQSLMLWEDSGEYMILLRVE